MTCVWCWDREPSAARMAAEGPWGGVDEITPGGLPTGPGTILRRARAVGYGFGPISLAMRMNHPKFPRFFLTWDYDIPSGKWSPKGGLIKTGDPINYKGTLALFEMLAEVAPDESA